MDFKTARKEILKLKIGESKTLYKAGDNTEIYIKRPEKQGSKLKREYEKQKNFQIFLKKPNKKAFRPNHLRLLIDLYLKKESDPRTASKVFRVIDKVYSGEAPEFFTKDLKGMKFKMQIDNADINVYCAQLFMLEQDINWEGKSKFNPPHLFIMGYIHFVESGEEEIDKIVRNAVSNPPPTKFTKSINSNINYLNKRKSKPIYLRDEQETLNYGI